MVGVNSPNWHNETCEDLCGCVEGVMRGLNNTQICMEVRGYPCHLLRQLLRASSNTNCSVGMEGTWFECDRGKTLCVGGDIGVDDENNCNEENSSSVWLDGGNTAYLGCETTVSSLNASVSCVLSRDRGVMGQCVNNAECLYKKERKSCPKRWEPFKRHCLSQNGIYDRLDWFSAQNKCMESRSPMLTMDSFEDVEITQLEEKGIFNPGQGVWLGLIRDANNTPFRWIDKTAITFDESKWPWAPGHPMSGRNFVYILDGNLYSSMPGEPHLYSCKMRVSKSLKCRQPELIDLPKTTDYEVVEMTTLEDPTTRPKRKLADALYEELEQVRGVMETFTNDTKVMSAVDSLISASSSGPVEARNSEEQSNDIEKSLDSLMDSLAEMMIGPSKPLIVSTPEIVMKVMTLCGDCDDDEAIGGQLGNQTFSLSLPKSVKAAGATIAISTASLLHEELPSTIEGSKTENTIGSLVTTISLRRWDGEAVLLTDDTPMELTFSNLEPKNQTAEASCRFWKTDGVKGGAWSSKGCSVASSNSTHTVCHMTHLTSFAVIMQMTHQQDLPKSLDYLTWAGCALSITCLAVMLIIFLTQKMYRADRNIIHMNLAVSLMLAQLIFVFGIDRTQDKNPQGVCKTVGILLHFFLLATFFWMLNEGIFLLSKTTSAKTRWLRLPTYFTVGWVFPLIIVCVTMAASFVSYDTVHRCWLTVGNGGIFAFIAPAAAVILINIGIIIQVIRVFLSLKANMNKKKVERIRIALRAILLTLPLLGCTWLIGLLSFNADTLVFAYIFVILNSLQGVFIFILYCLLNDEIKKGLQKRLASLQSLSGRTTNTRTSRTATGASNNHQPNRVNSKTAPEGYQEAVKL
ncbi:adhesion G protein-coupled receptor L2-like isoform X1 [Asterias rubens]|uniref:adhesion G protein-coupled receptor L2-like isoform X1 n=1 Tax=Asterias rubens TaxID=7604 RepID=UPI001455CEA2|nr:adhesion G protein-coupled receptor L2-like isoform X1 [Asterias rubens]